VSGVAADLALELQGLLLGRLGEFSLKRILLAPVATLLSLMVTFSFGQGPPLSRLVKRNRMNLMLPTLRTVSRDLLRNIHYYHYQLSIEKTTVFLYFFAMQADEER
jgi:hypothetical protein